MTNNALTEKSESTMTRATPSSRVLTTAKRLLPKSYLILVLLAIIILSPVVAWLWGKLQARLAHGASAERLGGLTHELEAERQRVAGLNAQLEALRSGGGSNLPPGMENFSL